MDEAAKGRRPRLDCRVRGNREGARNRGSCDSNDRGADRLLGCTVSRCREAPVCVRAVASAFDPEPGVDGIGDFIEFGGLEVLEGFEFHAGSLGVSRSCP